MNRYDSVYTFSSPTPSSRWLWVLAVIAISLLTVSTPQPAHAQQPNPQACNNFLNNMIPIIDQRQLEYKTISGQLFQGLPTHTTAPVTAVTPDNINNAPTDQNTSWIDFLGSDYPSSWPCSLTINVYETDGGAGYEIVAEYTPATAQKQDGRLVSSKQTPARSCSRSDARGADQRSHKRDWTCN